MKKLITWSPAQRAYWDPKIIQNFHGVSSHSPTAMSFVGVRSVSVPQQVKNEVIALPEPSDSTAGVSLRQVLQKRRSSIRFRGGMTLEEIGSLLGLAAGETNRTTFAGQEVIQLAYPTAGAVGAVSLQVWVQGTDSEIDGALWRYVPNHHGFTDRRSLTLQELEQCFAATYSKNVSIEHISLMCFLTVRLDILGSKYGARAYRLGHLEAGHLAQNLLLTAYAEGRAAIPWGGFFDQMISKYLRLSPEEVCTYAIPIG